MIEVRHLTKCYGDFPAVKDLSFEISEGHVYGFLGPNGAGKSTTMNIMTGCLSATEGQVLIGGHDIYEEPEAAKKLIGYLPEQPPLYMGETPVEYLRFVGEAKGLKGAELSAQVAEVIRRVGIEPVKHRLIQYLSKGYRQRVGIAQALLGNPKVIILDEPTVGLDPIQIVEIRRLIRDLGETHTVILSSHILSEVQAICEQVLIISHGRLVAFDTPENLEAMSLRANEVLLLADGDAQTVEPVLLQAGEIGEYSLEEQEDGTTSVLIHPGDANNREICRRLFHAFAEHMLPILEMTTRKANLEEVFIELTEKEVKDGVSVKTQVFETETADEPTAASEMTAAVGQKDLYEEDTVSVSADGYGDDISPAGAESGEEDEA